MQTTVAVLLAIIESERRNPSLHSETADKLGNMIAEEMLRRAVKQNPSMTLSEFLRSYDASISA